MSVHVARVQNGRLVLDEPTDLPDGVVVHLQEVDLADDLDEAERAARDASIERGLRDVEEGRHDDMRAVIARLRSRP